jgi:catechol 2,3-dioxygenase-like lactoylglutathione lyase family enzyme
MRAGIVSSDGPIISTGDMARQRALFEGVFGLVPAAEQALDEAVTHALFGIDGHTARSIHLVTPRTRIGVTLVQFDPLSQTLIRPGNVGIQTDALKVVDFFTTDLDRALARLRSFGFDLVAPPALLELPTGESFNEAHIRAPDGVIAAMIYPIEASIGDYVSVTDRLFSEVQSCSGPVADLEPVHDFYERVLGLGCGLQYRFESESFGRMIGTGGATLVQARNFGRVIEDVMLGVIHYGLPAGTVPSLKSVCRAPNRGLVAVQLRVEGLDDIVARCEAAGCEVAAPPAEVLLAPWGRIRVATVRGPHGVAHQLREIPTR